MTTLRFLAGVFGQIVVPLVELGRKWGTKKLGVENQGFNFGHITLEIP